MRVHQWTRMHLVAPVIRLVFSDETIEKNLLIRHALDRNVACRCLGATPTEDVLRVVDSTFGQFLAADICRVSSEL